MIVEDGTGVVGANSYVTEEYATGYFQNSGQFDWYFDSGTLVRATQAVDLLYGSRYLGSRLTREQSLQWPRSQFYDRDGFFVAENTIPDELMKAVCDLSLVYLRGGDPLGNDASGYVQSESASLEGMSSSTTYFAPRPTTGGGRSVSLVLKNILRIGGAGSGFSNIVRS